MSDEKEVIVAERVKVKLAGPVWFIDRRVLAWRVGLVLPIALALVLGRWPSPQFTLAQEELPVSCRNGVSSTEIVESARIRAELNGLQPPDGESMTLISKLQPLTVEEHDLLYPEERLRGPGISPQPGALDCIWRVEVDGVGWFFGGRPGFYGFTRHMDFGFDGTSGDLRYDVIHFHEDPWRAWLPIAVTGR